MSLFIAFSATPNIYNSINIKLLAPICSRRSNIPLDPNSPSSHRWDGLFSCGFEDVPLPVGARREVAGRVGC
ncbi:MAG: hypothetical protein ABOK23_06970 [Candidatus Methanoperedens sp.]|nr:hypothetical protein [Candidatus Methanoperedens sp.]